MKKHIGTAVPLFALRSSARHLQKEKHGTFATAMVFLDWLKRTRQTIWQVLPLSETHLEPGSRTRHVPSPYKGYGIGLNPRYLALPWSLLDPSPEERAHFIAEQASWLEDYALFCALRDRFGTDDWTTWKHDIRVRKTNAMAYWTKNLRAEIDAHIDTQWRCHRAFKDVRTRAKADGILLVGDMPFYLPLQSPLVWSRQECFELSRLGAMRRFSGVPVGPKSHFGRQVWGHPLYDWASARKKRQIVELWKLRIAHIAQMYDYARLDHAKGFYNYGAMHPTNPKKDRVEYGPGNAVLEELIHTCRQTGLEMFAEDSGDRLRDLRKTLRAHRVPGIRLLRFGYNEQRKKLEMNYADVANYPVNTFAYTTSHDTDTLFGYVRLLSSPEKQILAEAVGIRPTRSDRAFAVALRNAVIASPARLVIISLEDWVLTTNRINIPGTEKPIGDRNWRYRMSVPIEKLPKKLFANR